MNSTIKTTFVFTTFLVLLSYRSMIAGEITFHTDSATGWKIPCLSQGRTSVKLAPQAGSNLFSIQFDGVEYLRQPQTVDQLLSSSYGNPVLYPTPNRVKASKFTFRSREFILDKNFNKNFIHGVVRNAPWQIVGSRVTSTEAELTCAISFEAGQEHFERFPLSHKLRLKMTVTDDSVRWEYEVDNLKGAEAIPFGFALHPYFIYQGDRDETYLTIPATHWMESEKQMPSGKLIDAKALQYPLGYPMSLKGTSFDDVFFGMRPENPTVIDFREVKKSIRIEASSEFTHLVVWTPNQQYFGIENQTCSTDAHNLDSNGATEAAHLQVCEPGESKTGWVKYQFSSNQ